MVWQLMRSLKKQLIFWVKMVLSELLISILAYNVLRNIKPSQISTIIQTLLLVTILSCYNSFPPISFPLYFISVSLHCFIYMFHFLVDYSCSSIFTSSLSSCSTMMTPCCSHSTMTHLLV